MHSRFRTSRFSLIVLLMAALALIAPTAAATTRSAPSDALSSSEAGDVQAAPGDPPGLAARAQQLRQNARGSVAMRSKSSTSKAAFIRAGQNGDLLPGNSAMPQGKARGFFNAYGDLLGVSDASAELIQIGSAKDSYGGTHLTYKQVYKGVLVFGGLLSAHFDANNNLTAVNGVFVPEIDLVTTPKLNAAEAGKLAVAAVVADPPRSEEGVAAAVSAKTLKAANTTLYVYRLGLIRDVAGTSQLAYQVEVTNGSNVRDFVFVHAHSGKMLNRYSAVNDALHRVVYEQNTSNKIWEEGDPFPGSLNQDQRNIVNFSGDSYYHFFNAFGRDSYDGAGAYMQTVNNDPRINCPNANWNGVTTNYCNGVTADDIVAHEWGHAYTEYTQGLIYQWQPGALNESYSDIWGETVDQLNGVGTDSPNSVRSVGACSTHTTPVPVLVINSPVPGTCAAGAAAFGPPLTAAGTTGALVLGLDDANASGPSTTDACTALTNASEMNGKIALVDRGTCAFTIKVKNAQNAGAIGVVVANSLDRPAFGMAGSDPTIVIPSLGISTAHGDLLKGYLSSGPANVTLTVKGGSLPPEDSYRWLMGEDSSAFGGAIRDMWNPTCLSDPGKVTDAEYQCDSGDGGGVHTNSGVPNHGYALLVDGGVYNGYTVDAIGMTKAAHIYWRAQSVYQTPTTDFADHADSLEQSCQDLIGQPLNKLSTVPGDSGPSGQSIASSDCAQVAKMAAAVELRFDPTAQCNFKPLLDPNTPSLCSTKNSALIWGEDFEDGLAGWTLSNQGVYAGWNLAPTDWMADSSLPGGRSGTAAYAAAPDVGNCDGGVGDISGAMFLESPSIHVPSSKTLSPRLVFDHYLATEFLYDGGNIKISINGGAFTLIPASAFNFNPYNTPALQPTNPLAVQAGFSGSDGGEVTGSWGQSQIDLTAINVKPGDNIKVRFDFGRDGCGGNDGWYVDNVQLRACNAKKE